jgi:hypothetical protein
MGHVAFRLKVGVALLTCMSGFALAEEMLHPIDALCSGRCAGTGFAGVQLRTGTEEIFGSRGHFVPPWDYKFGDSYFIGGALSREIIDVMGILGFEAEAGVGQRFGSMHESEAWGALYVRWKYFPWNETLRTTIAASTGVSYASGIPAYEIKWSGNMTGSKTLHYFSPEITFARPANPNTALVLRIHHRSGGADWWGESHPIFGKMFHNINGGVQYLNVGIRQYF